MKVYNEVTETYTRKELIETICDICGKRTSGEYWEGYDDDVADVIVSYSTSHTNCDETLKKTISFDICPDCFKNKLVPWLESQGARTKYEEEWF